MRRVVALVAAALVGAVLVTGGPVAAQQGPSLVVGANHAQPGQEITVRGEGWPASKLVVVETCGNGGRDGSTHCDQATTRTVSTSRDGVLTGQVTVGLPPSPCPCVIHAFVVGGASQQVPLTIEGVPVVELPPEEEEEGEPPAGQLSVQADLEDTSSWMSWFGAAPTRRLVLTIENTGERTVSWAPLDLSWGRPTNPTGAVDVPDLDPLAPGESTRLEVAVELDPLAFGDYVVRGHVVGHPEAAFSVRTSSHPWGLLVLPVLLVVQFLLVRARNALARAVARRLPEAGAPDPEGQAGPAEPAWDLEVVLRDGAEPDVVLDLTSADPEPDPDRQREPV